MDELGAIRKDLSLGCEIEDFLKRKYICIDNKTCSNRWTSFSISWKEIIIWHPPILSDCMSALYARLQLFDTYEQDQNCEKLLESFPYNYDYSKPYLHQQLDELGEKLLSLLS